MLQYYLNFLYYLILLYTYFCLSIILICLIYLTAKHLSRQTIIFSRLTNDIPALLQRYYKVNNLFDTCIASFIYLFYTVFLILILRLLNVGKATDINESLLSNISNTNYINPCIILLLLLCLRFLILKTFYTDIIRLYLYFQQYKWFDKLVHDIYCWYTFDLEGEFIIDLRLYLYRIILNKDTTNIKLTAREKQIRSYMQSNSRRYESIVFIYRSLSYFPVYYKTLLFNSPIILIALALAYDLQHQIINITYYTLLLYFIVHTIRRVLIFASHVDHILDERLSKFMYYNEENAHKKYMLLNDIFNREQTILHYIKGGFVIDYQQEVFAFWKEKENTIQKAYIIISIMILWLVVIQRLDMINTIICTLPLSILIATAYKKDRLCRLISLIMFIVNPCLIAYIYIKQRVLTYMTEILWDKYITIVQQFTEEDKIKFMCEYIRYRITKNTTLPQNTKTFIEDKLIHMDVLSDITEQTTIIDIKAFVDNLIPTLQQLQENYIYIDDLLTEIYLTNNLYQTLYIILLLSGFTIRYFVYR